MALLDEGEEAWPDRYMDERHRNRLTKENTDQNNETRITFTIFWDQEIQLIGKKKQERKKKEKRKTK